MKSKERLFLIDGNSFCYRAFYAIRELSTSKGQPTNAIYGVATMVMKLLKEENPQYLGVAFDAKAPTFRHRRFEAYKGHRPPMPEGLSAQLPWIKELLKAFRIPLFEKEGFEADDILGTMALQAVRTGIAVFLVTGDKDAFQLLGPGIAVYRPTRDGHEMIDEEELAKRWHVRPDQVVEVMALMGDDVDGVPGVPGIGQKTAVELIQRFGSVEKILAHLDQVPGTARRAALESHVDQLRLSRELVTLDTQVPIPVDWEALKKTEPDRQALRRLFETLEFRTLLKELPADHKTDVQLKSFPSREAFKECLTDIRRRGALAVSLAAGSQGAGPQLVEGAGLAWDLNAAWKVEDPAWLADLKELWEDRSVVKICSDLKEALILFDRLGLRFNPPWADPELASYLLNPGRPSHRIEELSLEWLGESVESTDSIEAASRIEAAALYAQAAFRLWPRLKKEVEEKELLELLTEVEIPLAECLARMEMAGMGVDRQALADLAQQMEQVLDRLTSQIYAQAGGPFNINSPKQLASVLFEKLKLPVIKRTKTGASTDEEVLRRLSTLHELPAKLLEYREMFKLKSTYVDALPKLIDPKTGRIHTSFNQTVTATGRLSSSEPNLQNIPIRTELGRQIRRAFVPASPGYLFLAADYSQIELRILAHLSQDAGLLKAFSEGQDIHRVTAANVFHVSLEAVTSSQRAAAKTINFGIIYGMSPFGLAKELGISQQEAIDFIERYFAQYPGVRVFLDRVLEETREKGYCTTLFHRRRYIPEINAKDVNVRQFAERTALNAPIQGSAADLIKIAMVHIDRAIQEKGLQSRMLLTVHDELVFEVPMEELGLLQDLVKRLMEAPSLKLSVPIEVNVKTGRNWLEASHA